MVQWNTACKVQITSVKVSGLDSKDLKHSQVLSWFSFESAESIQLSMAEPWLPDLQEWDLSMEKQQYQTSSSTEQPSGLPAKCGVCPKHKW